MALLMRRTALPGSAVASRRDRLAVVRKASDSSSSNAPLKTPEWVPEQAAPVVGFLESTSFKVTDVPLYKQYVAKYTESKYFAESTGFKAIPETVNGRAAMLGFVAAAGAEIFGQGPFFAQLSHTGLTVVVIIAAITAASIIPIVKGTEGSYLASLRDTYSLPEGVFTEKMERVHGRLAMLGLASLIALELVAGRAIL